MDTIKLNITQLNSLIKRIIDAEEYLQIISVYGEVSNFKISAGNAYFDIKEDGAQLACIKFGASGLDIANGDMVLLTGRLNYYVKTGKLSFIANRIEPYGLGALYKQYLALKEQLADEGLFDERFKKELPQYANKVGVVTSQTGAVIRDIIHVARKKNNYTDIIVYPARVQGAGAEQEVIAGLNYFESTDVDVVIIARGGGSFEDLAPFNTVALARAIFSCKKPIISAVGHETDFSISDFVADMRAPTPSVAAEIAFYDYSAVRGDIAAASNKILTQCERVIADYRAKLGDNCNNIYNMVNSRLAQGQLMLSGALAKITSAIEGKIASKKTDFMLTSEQIDKINPLNLLDKGYALVYAGQTRVTDANSLKLGDKITIQLKGGRVVAQIINPQE